MWSFYWDKITDRLSKYLSDVLMSYQWEIEFCCRGSKILDLIRNSHQSYYSFCDTLNISTIKLFVFSNLVPRISCFSIKEGGVLHIKEQTCPGNKVVYLVTACKFNCGRKRKVSYPTKNKKNRWVKKDKKLRKS